MRVVVAAAVAVVVAACATPTLDRGPAFRGAAIAKQRSSTTWPPEGPDGLPEDLPIEPPHTVPMRPPPRDRVVNVDAARETMAAELALIRGDVPAAVVAWRAAVHADDTSPYLRTRLGEALLMVGDVEGATVVADAAIHLGADDKDDAHEVEHVAAAWRLRALARSAAGDDVGAVAALRAALVVQPGEARASGLLAERLVAAGDLDGAEAVVAAWMKDARDVRGTVYGTVQLAKVFADRQLVPRAMALLDDALAKSPDDDNALETRRDLLLALGRWDEAAVAARAFVAAVGDSAATRSAMITTLSLTAPSEARALASALLAEDDSERSRLIVADAFEAAGLLDDAAAALAVEGGADSRVIVLERARLALGRHDATAARAACRVVASEAIDADNARLDDYARQLCAEARVDDGDIDGGTRSLVSPRTTTRPSLLRKLASLAPRVDATLRQELKGLAQRALHDAATVESTKTATTDDITIAAAQLLAATGDISDALSALDRVQQTRPSPAVRLARVRILGTDVDSSDADVLAAITAIERHDPLDVDRLNFIAFSLAERGLRAQDAVGFAWRAVLRDPTNGYVTDTLGWAQLQAGLVDDAIATLQRADRLAPGEAEVQFHLAVALARRGNDNAADDVAATTAITRAKDLLWPGDPLRARIDVVAAALAQQRALPARP